MKHVWKSFVGIKKSEFFSLFFSSLCRLSCMPRLLEVKKYFPAKMFFFFITKRGEWEVKKEEKKKEKKVNRKSYYTFSLFFLLMAREIYLHAITSTRFLLSPSRSRLCLFFCLFINFFPFLQPHSFLLLFNVELLWMNAKRMVITFSLSFSSLSAVWVEIL